VPGCYLALLAPRRTACSAPLARPVIVPASDVHFDDTKGKPAHANDMEIVETPLTLSMKKKKVKDCKKALGRAEAAVVAAAEKQKRQAAGKARS